MQHKSIHVTRFSLIEVMVSLALLLVIAVGVLALLPQSMQSNQEAINRMAAADGADQILSFFSSRLESNWDDLQAIPVFKHDGSEDELVFSAESLISSSGLNIYFAAANEMESWDPRVANTGVFKIRQMTSSSMVDFEGMVRLWKNVGGGVDDETINISVKLFAEISWPTALPYADRRKETYNLSVYRPGSTATQDLVYDEVGCKAAWGIDGTSVYYHELNDEATQTANKEGDLIGLPDSANVEAVTISNGGTVFLINNGGESECALYKMSPGQFDGNSTTKVMAVKVGTTGVSTASSERISALLFSDDTLYAFGRSSGKVYTVNPQSGTATLLANTGSSISVGAAAVGNNGDVYLADASPAGSALYKFSTFPSGAISKVMNIEDSSAIESLTSHPNGKLYAADNGKWHVINPVGATSEVIVNISNSLQGADFFFSREQQDCNEQPDCETTGAIGGLVNINPSNNNDFSFYMETADGTTIERADLMHNNSYDFDGEATFIRFRPKGNGNQNSMTIDGVSYDLKNGTLYIISGTAMQVHLYNSTAGQGSTMGKWYLQFDGSAGTAGTCDQGADGGDDTSDDGAGDEEEIPVVGKNDPCPCGSGEKYFKCHGK